MDIREFLEARLADDEATARAAADFGERWRFADDIFPSDESRHPGAIIAGSYGCGIPDQYGNHVVRHDPVRALRDVASSRKLSELAALLMGWSAEHVATVTEPEIKSMRFAGREILRQLATRWSDHPEYDPAWSPT